MILRVFLTVVLALTPLVAHAEMALHSPFVVSKQGTSKMLFACPRIMTSVKDLKFSSIYKDKGTSSVIDPDNLDAYRKSTKPLNDFEKQITRISNDYMMLKTARSQRAQCVAAHLAQWAEDEALLGDVNLQGQAVRKWALASVAAAYLQLSNNSALEKSQKQIIENWLANVSAKVMDDYAMYPDNRSRNNNHAYWAGWAVGLTAVILNDKKRFDWAMMQARKGLDQVNAQGFLPLELQRKTLALNYHVYAAGPLMALVDLGEKNNVKLFGYNNYAMRRLTQRIVTGLKDEAIFVEETGVKQDLARTRTGPMLGWMHIYRRYDASIKSMPDQEFKNVFQPRLGGNMARVF